ncbi:MAG: glycosyltransferase [Bacteroidales bacterium]
MTENLVAIVIINYNSSKYTIECLKSIKDVVDPNFNYSIIIIDNNSKTDDYKELKTFVKAQQDIKLIRSKVNLGFSGANMLAVQHTNSEYVFFLNNDTILLNDCISILYNFMKSNKDVGVCTGQMFNTDLSFHHSFNYFPTLSIRLLGSGLMRSFKPEKYPNKKKGIC